MKPVYIKSLAEAYVIDNKLYKENLSPEELYENFYGLIKEMRISQPDLVAVLENANKFEQQGLFKNYFDLIFKSDEIFKDIIIESEEELQNLNEIFPFDPFTWGMFFKVILVLIAWKRKAVSKTTIQAVNGITSAFNYIGKFLSKVGTQTQLAYAIIQKNSKKCYDECKFDPENASFSNYMVQFKKGDPRRDVGKMVQTEKEDEKMECLRMCYLQTMKEIVKLTAHSYFTCLKNTGDLSRLPLERDFSAYQNVLVHSNLNQSCDNFVEMLSKAFENYDKVVELVYSDEPTEARKQRNELMMDIYNIQKSFSGDNRFPVKAYQQDGGKRDQFRSRPQR